MNAFRRCSPTAPPLGVQEEQHPDSPNTPFTFTISDPDNKKKSCMREEYHTMRLIMLGVYRVLIVKLARSTTTHVFVYHDNLVRTDTSIL